MKISSGIMPYRIKNNQLEVFLVHPGGPFNSKKDIGYWGISKGEINKDESLLQAALREFKEETGVDLSTRINEFIELGSIIQKNGKEVFAWAIEYIEDIKVSSNTTTIEWPPKSGRKMEIPEVDRGEFFAEDEAVKRINVKQAEFITRLREKI